MKRLNVIGYLLTIILFGSCYKNPVERNKIVFKNKINEVQDSLLKMIILLKKLPNRSDGLNTNYKIKNSRVYINDTLVNKEKLHSDTYLRNLNLEQKVDFIRLSWFLDRNSLSSAYFEGSDNLWHFIYRDFPERSFNDTRDI